MIIEMMKPSDLIPYKNNPRKNENAIDKVATSISEYGFKQPIVIDKNNVIIVGHTRWKAALKMGLEEVPVLKAEDLTPAQAKAYRIADNKTNEFADWDWEGLNLELDELKELDVDMDWLELSETGEGYTDGFALPDGEKEPFQQMTFTLSDEQAEAVQTAIKKAKQNDFSDTGNENSNGNALWWICQSYE